MKKFLVLVLGLLFSLSGCKSIDSAAKINTNLQPTVTPDKDLNISPNTNSDKSKNESEIKECLPQKLYRGDVLTVSFHPEHSGYLAILRLSDRRWFFLNDVPNSFPVFGIEELKKLSEIKINTADAVNTTNSEENKINERIFRKTGKYRIMTSNEDFGQDDPPWTGMCEVFYYDKLGSAKK